MNEFLLPTPLPAFPLNDDKLKKTFFVLWHTKNNKFEGKQEKIQSAPTTLSSSWFSFLVIFLGTFKKLFLSLVKSESCQMATGLSRCLRRFPQSVQPKSRRAIYDHSWISADKIYVATNVGAQRLVTFCDLKIKVEKL